MLGGKHQQVIRKQKKKSYQGAMIYDPLSENTNGLHLNVAAFDYAGLYPAMMIFKEHFV